MLSILFASHQAWIERDAALDPATRRNGNQRMAKPDISSSVSAPAHERICHQTLYSPINAIMRYVIGFLRLVDLLDIQSACASQTLCQLSASSGSISLYLPTHNDLISRIPSYRKDYQCRRRKAP